jgi:hypothetical protein
MDTISLIAIVIMVVITTKVRTSNFGSKAASRKAFIEEFRRRKEKRRDRFVQLGLRPLQIGLWVSLLVYVFSVIGAVFYYWQQVQLLGWLAMPALLILSWYGSFSYARTQFSINAGVTALSVFLDYRHIADHFGLIGAAGRVLVVVFALLIYAKMKDPVFARPRDAA